MAGLALTMLAVAGGLLVAACSRTGNALPPGTLTSASTIAAGLDAPSPAVVSVLTGAGPEEKRSGAIKVAAASDLRGVMGEVQPGVEHQCGTAVTFVFGSSGTLANQIEAGAAFGLLLSADSQYPADLVRAGKVVANGTASYGIGRLVLATRAGLQPVTDLNALTRPDIKRIAIANPGHAPYGRAAKEALERAGVYAAIQGKLVLGENIRQTTDYVEKGDADAAIVALALVVNGSPLQYTIIDSSLHTPIEQTGAVIKGTGAELTGRCILQYLLDPAGQDALRKFGFEAIHQ